MSKKCVCAIIESEAQSREIISQLKQAGFLNGDLSALLPDQTGNQDFGHEHHTKAPEGAAAGGVIGAVLCGGTGILAGIGTLAIPGLGPLIAAGPVLAALSGAAIGFTAGGLVGAVIGYARPEYVARRYDGKLGRGNILLSVHCKSDDLLRRARNILEDRGGANIAIMSEAEVRNTERKGLSVETAAA